jgi:hypothetical protein
MMKKLKLILTGLCICMIASASMNPMAIAQSAKRKPKANVKSKSKPAAAAKPKTYADISKKLTSGIRTPSEKPHDRKIPPEHHEAVSKFLTLLDTYRPNMKGDELDNCLEKINLQLAQFSQFKVEVSKPLSKKDKVPTILGLYGTVVQMNLRGPDVPENDVYFLFKLNGKWTVYGSFFDHIQNYRNIGEMSGYFEDQSLIKAYDFSPFADIIPSAVRN